MKKILVFVDSFHTGGITEVVKHIYRRLDRTKYEMSFLRCDGGPRDFDEEIEKNGDKVYIITKEQLPKVPVINYSILTKRMVKKIRNAVGNDKYDVAYIHSNAFFCVPGAKALGIKKIIMHVHEAVSDFGGNEEKSAITKLIWKRRQRMYNRLASYKVGVSKKACIAKFGENVVNDKKMRVIHPSVDTEKFDPDRYDKDSIAKEFSVDEAAFNMIHVGRLFAVKNQAFMLDILKEISKIRKCHLYIIYIGSVEMNNLVNKAKALGVYDMVTFLPGNTTAGLYKLMNCSLLPSFSESFGMVAVESQMMNVPCFASTNVPDDVDVGLCVHLPLEDGAKAWADKILNYDYENARLDEEKAKEFTIECIIKKTEKLFD